LTNPTHTADNSRITVSIDPDLEEIVPGFLDNRRRDVSTLEAALADQDLKMVRLLGHRMKGDGAGYGFEAISTIGETLEQAAIREDQTAITEQIRKLNDFLTRVEVVYRR
jgi:HPt (histidine-containing phosphotransfer) domain-containing protein